MIDENVGTIGIIGAGPKGREVAVYALLGGYRVILEDMSSERLAEANAHISEVLAKAAVSQKRKTLGNFHAASNLSTTQSMDDALRGADFLIETAPEEAELQLEIFTIFDKFAKPQAIMASTAGSVPIADLAEMTNCAERCVGLHFPASVTAARILQIVRTPQTSDRTLRTCVSFAATIGLEPKIESELASQVTFVREKKAP
jgi:3-hydroxybutyryl-CoA dehydrogenase